MPCSVVTRVPGAGYQRQHYQASPCHSALYFRHGYRIARVACDDRGKEAGLPKPPAWLRRKRSPSRAARGGHTPRRYGGPVRVGVANKSFADPKAARPPPCPGESNRQTPGCARGLKNAPPRMPLRTATGKALQRELRTVLRDAASVMHLAVEPAPGGASTGGRRKRARDAIRTRPTRL
jgi:hypothetical protein